MSITMYDSISAGTIPANPQAVAGYVGGNWPNFDSLVQQFPAAHHLSIAVNAGQRARCLDVEAGDASPSEAPGWIRTNYVGPGLPVLYASASNVQELINTCANAGIARSEYLIWSAHYSNEHICGPGTCGYPQADGAQWTQTALGRNLDQSLLNDNFFGPPPPPPPPPDPYHYDRFDTGPFPSKWGPLNERFIVLHYDGARKHPVRYFWYLLKLRKQLRFLADRVWTVANEQKDPDGQPSWDKFYRGFRYQQLNTRANGGQVAK